MLNVDAVGQTRAATITVAPNANGIQIYSSAAAHLIVDVVGYYTGPSAALSADGLFIPQSPVRIYDSRLPGGSRQPGRATAVTGLGSSPAMAVSLTAVGASQLGWASLYPAGNTDPNTSSINFGAGETVANHAVGATLSSLTISAPVDMIVDQYGTFR